MQTDQANTTDKHARWVPSPASIIQDAMWTHAKIETKQAQHDKHAGDFTKGLNRPRHELRKKRTWIWHSKITGWTCQPFFKWHAYMPLTVDKQQLPKAASLHCPAMPHIDVWFIASVQSTCHSASRSRLARPRKWAHTPSTAECVLIPRFMDHVGLDIDEPLWPSTFTALCITIGSIRLVPFERLTVPRFGASTRLLLGAWPPTIKQIVLHPGLWRHCPNQGWARWTPTSPTATALESQKSTPHGHSPRPTAPIYIRTWQHQMTTMKQPFQCNLQPEIQEPQRTTHTGTSTRCKTHSRNNYSRIKTTAAATAAQTRYLSSPAAATLHRKTQGFVLRLPPQHKADATSCSHSNAISHHSFRKRIELRTQEQALVTKHIGGTIRAWNDRSCTRRGTFHRRLQPL